MIIPTKESKPRGKTGRVGIMFYFDDEATVAALDEACRVTGQTRTAVCRYLIAYGLEAWRLERVAP